MPYRILEGCPHCGGYPVTPSSSGGLLERLRRRLTGKQLFRCERCGWRGWADESWDRRRQNLPPPGNVDRRRPAAPPGSSGPVSPS